MRTFPVQRAALACAFLATACPKAGAPPSARVEHDVVYGRAGEVELCLDAYVPAGAGPHPALLLVHGGAWMHGDRRDMAELGTALSQEGYACFAIQYRLAPAHRFPAQIEDCQRAVQFVREEAARWRVDPERLGALGPSAGGHLALLLGVLDDARRPEDPDPELRQSTRVQAVVDYFGPALLTRERVLEFDTLPPPEVFGDAPDSAFAAASPVNFVTRDDAPCLLVHGDADEVVPVGHSILMQEALEAAGVPCELVVVEGGGHGDFFAREPHGEPWQRTLAFLGERLRGSAAAAELPR